MEIALGIIGLLILFGMFVGLSVRFAIIEEMLDSNIRQTTDAQKFERNLDDN